jgi:hypothetical protein
MEFEQGGWAGTTAAFAVPTHVRHRPELPRTPVLNDSVPWHVIDESVTEAVAVRTQQIAFGRFDQQALVRPMEVPESEVFARCVAMMEFEGGRDAVVAAVFAAAPAQLDQLRLT